MNDRGPSDPAPKDEGAADRKSPGDSSPSDDAVAGPKGDDVTPAPIPQPLSLAGGKKGSQAPFFPPLSLAGERKGPRDRGPQRGPLDLVLAAAATLVCLLFTGPLLDTPRSTFVTPPFVAPPLPDDDAVERDAALHVDLVDEHEAPVAGAKVSVFTIRDEQAYAAADAVSREAGGVDCAELPRGEAWVLAEAPGTQRSSSHLVLLAEPRSLKLVLRPARSLGVHVTDEDGRPLGVARVELRAGDPLSYAAITKASGDASLGRLGPPPWTVEVSRAGFETVRRGGVMPGPLPLQVVLHALGSFVIETVTAEGAPVGGATVWVAGSALWPARSLTADGAGKATVAGLRAGAYDLAALSGDLVSATQLGVTLARGETKAQRLTLVPGRRVTVRVVDGMGDDAEAVKGASVVASEAGLASFPREGVTGEGGAVVLGPLPLGEAFVSARAEGFVPKSVVVAASQSGPVEISLTRGGTLLGEVVDARGDAIQGASVEVVGVDLGGMPVDETPDRTSLRDAHFAFALGGPAALVPSGELGVMPGPLPHMPPAGAFVVSDAPAARFASRAPGGPAPEPWVSNGDGQFRAAPLPPGRLRALVRHPAYVEALSDAVTVDPGKEAKVRVVMHAGGAIDGRVLDESRRPVAGVRVTLAAAVGSLSRTAVTADDGTFAFASVPREVTLTVARAESPETPVLRREVTVNEDERSEVTLTLPSPRGGVALRVLDDRGAPVAAAQVRALSLSPDVPLRTTLFTRADGTVELPDAAGLTLRFEVAAPGFAPLSRDVEKAEANVSLTLAKGASVRGEVSARRGRDAVDGAEVAVYTARGVRRTRTDAEGAYAFRDLAPGPARLVVAAVGYARREVDLVVERPDRDRVAKLDRVDLDEAGSVDGEVVDARGDPAPGARVAVGAVPAFVPLGAAPAGVTIADSRGQFHLADVAPGDATIEGYSPDLGRARASGVRVRAGRTTTGVRLRLGGEPSAPEPAASGGVAVTLAEDERGGASVVRVAIVAEASEAERAGVRADDVLEAVGGEPVSTLEQARRKLAGPVGEDVVVRVRRGEQSVTLRVARERVRR